MPGRMHPTNLHWREMAAESAAGSENQFWVGIEVPRREDHWRDIVVGRVA